MDMYYHLPRCLPSCRLSMTDLPPTLPRLFILHPIPRISITSHLTLSISQTFWLLLFLTYIYIPLRVSYIFTLDMLLDLHPGVYYVLQVQFRYSARFGCYRRFFSMITDSQWWKTRRRWIPTIRFQVCSWSVWHGMPLSSSTWLTVNPVISGFTFPLPTSRRASVVSSVSI
ncbi:hypothetical protein BDN67DRAFT_455224 [Paxillus ammoniavirescens]|nr:hypothetical protein BDN67DRAFT_455224 [Paxillus ammoniavirescens]